MEHIQEIPGLARMNEMATRDLERTTSQKDLLAQAARNETRSNKTLVIPARAIEIPLPSRIPYTLD